MQSQVSVLTRVVKLSNEVNIFQFLVDGGLGLASKALLEELNGVTKLVLNSFTGT